MRGSSCLPGSGECDHELHLRATVKILFQPGRQLREHELAGLAAEVGPSELRLGAVRLQVEPVHAAQCEVRGAILRRVDLVVAEILRLLLRQLVTRGRHAQEIGQCSRRHQ